MIDFDSDYLRLPLVPFIVELHDRSFLVKIPLCRAAQDEFLPHFDLIEVKIKNHKNKAEWLSKPIGHKTVGFLATCSSFILIAEDGYKIIFEPSNDWNFERWEAGEYPCFSLNEEPADDIEAYDIYQNYQDERNYHRFKMIEELLRNGKISIERLNNDGLRGYIDYIRNAKVFIPGFDKYEFLEAYFIAASNNKPIGEKRNRVKVKDVDLLVTYHFILSNQPTISQQQARNKAIKLKFPDISDDELARRNEALKKLIKEHANDAELNFLFPEEQVNG